MKRANKGPGIERIAAERARHKALGYDDKHDDKSEDGDIAMAAACYAATDPIYICDYDDAPYIIRFHDAFPYNDDDRPRNADGDLKRPTLKQRIRLLEKAGALIAAEIDRLLRIEK